MVNSFEVDANKLLFKVPLVAKIPMLLDCVFKAAGLIAGSIPIIGTSKVLRKVEMAFVVAVFRLQR